MLIRIRATARTAFALSLIMALPALAPAHQEADPASDGIEAAEGKIPPSAVLRAALTATNNNSLRASVSRDSDIIKELVYRHQEEAEGPQRQPYGLSLLDAIEQALRHNYSIQVARYAPDQSFEGITQARAPFDTNLTFRLPQTFNRSTTPSTQQTQGADVITRETFSGGFTWQETLEWGTNYSIQFNSSRSVDNNAFNIFNPSLSSNVLFNVQQQLLRGFGDVNRTGIRVAMNNYEGSLEQFRDTVQTLVLQVYQAYWNLRAQVERVRVQEEAVALAQQQLDRNRIQVEIGTLAPIETVQAETSVANNQLGLVNARLQLENFQDQLKQLINFDLLVDDPFAHDLTPTDEPEVSTAPIDVEEAVRIALERDPQLIQLRYGLTNAQMQLRQARNNLLPQLSVNANVNLQGRGGDRIIRGAFGGEASEIQESGFTTALAQVFSGDFNAWSLGLTLVMPLHNYAAKAGHANASIGERRAFTQVAQREQIVVYTVRNSARQVENLVSQVEVAQRTRELTQRQFDAEQRKFEVGTSTNFQVLQFQDQLRQSQLNELQTILNLQNAIATLEQSKATLLESLGLSIEDAGRGGRR